MTVNSFCEEGHSYYKNIRDYYKLFSDERNEIREDICSICRRENEFYPEISYKYCKICNEILCRICEKEHIKNNPQHELDKKLNPDINCVEHKINYSYFCEDCFKNLCNECLNNHNNLNIGHNLKKIEKINDEIIENAKKNITKIKMQILNYETILKTFKNYGYKISIKINFVKLFVLFKLTFLEMYENIKTNYNVVSNFLENNLELRDLGIDTDEEGRELYDIFTPLFNKSISSYENVKTVKLFDNKINDIFPISNGNYFIVAKNDIKIVNDLNVDFIEFNINIDKKENFVTEKVYKLKNGNFLISFENKLKLYSLVDNNNQTYSFQLLFEFPEFTKNKINKIIELSNGKLIILSNGFLTVFEKNENKYKIFKNNFHLFEKIVSIIEFDEKKLIAFAEIKNEDKCSHLEIIDAETFNIIYNSSTHFIITKNEDNLIKIDENSIIASIEKSSKTYNKNAILYFNISEKNYSVFTNHLQYFKLLKIDNRCCVGITKFRGKFCLEQFEIINTVENIKSNIIGFKIFDEKEIPNVFFIKENMIVFNNDGSLNIMN